MHDYTEMPAPGASTLPQTQHEKIIRERMKPLPGATTPAPVETPRVRVQKPVTEVAPAGATPVPAAETPRVPRHAPKAEVPAVTAHSATPVERPATVERPKPAAAPVEPKEKKAPKNPKHDGQTNEH
jgi:hypothetical protein